VTSATVHTAGVCVVAVVVAVQTLLTLMTPARVLRPRPISFDAGLYLGLVAGVRKCSAMQCSREQRNYKIRSIIAASLTSLQQCQLQLIQHPQHNSCK
jgi:hypothetical protein